MSYWAGVITGACVASVLFAVGMFTIIEQNNRLKEEIKALSEKVAEHDEIMQAYAFYNWQYSLQMNKED